MDYRNRVDVKPVFKMIWRNFRRSRFTFRQRSITRFGRYYSGKKDILPITDRIRQKTVTFFPNKSAELAIEQPRRAGNDTQVYKMRSVN